MRGKDLGQYFTPRSIVKLMTKMAHLDATPKRQDRAIDGCCGTGGFLIEVLTEMRDRVRKNDSLSYEKKEELLERIANECIYGIDFGKSPPIAKIARINMYLHGDGGSKIYYADALDKAFEPFSDEPPETLANQAELRALLAGDDGFDVALTNPPFSMTKELENESEAKILKVYDLAKLDGTNKFRPSLRSSAMFIERYRDLLRPGGRLFTVIDETLLSSVVFSYVREFIRKEFLVRAIISLPGDAFRRSGARVKTSVLCLERKSSPDEKQPSVFFAFAESIGVDDLPSKASVHDVRDARIKADAEIKKISTDFEAFLNGGKRKGTVKPDRIADRLDLKYVVPLQGRMVDTWRKAGNDIKTFGAVVEVIVDPVVPQNFPNEDFKLIAVTYKGYCRVEKTQSGNRVVPPVMYRVRQGDLVFSNIRATDGAVGIVPRELDGALVSASFTVLRCGNYSDTVYLWSVLRSHEIRADLMSLSTGTSRYTTDWDDAQTIAIPWPPEANRKSIAAGFIKAWKLEKQIEAARNSSLDLVADLGVESDASIQRFNSYKAPK